MCFYIVLFLSFEQQAFINRHETEIYLFIAYYLGRIFLIEFVVEKVQRVNLNDVIDVNAPNGNDWYQLDQPTRSQIIRVHRNHVDS